MSDRLADLLPEGPEREAVLKMYGPDATVAVAVKGVLEARNALASSRRVPSKDAPPEEWSKYHDANGRPKTPEEYNIPEGAPAGIRRILEGVRSVAHTKGLTQEQFESLAAEAASAAGASAKQIADLRNAWEAQFRAAHGSKADERLATAKATMEQILGDDPTTKEALEAAGLDNHPALLNAILKVGKAMGDDKAPFAASPAAPTGPTGAQLYVQYHELRETPQYKDPRHPLHAKALSDAWVLTQKVTDLGFDGFSDPKLRMRPDLTALLRRVAT